MTSFASSLAHFDMEPVSAGSPAIARPFFAPPLLFSDHGIVRSLVLTAESSAKLLHEPE